MAAKRLRPHLAALHEQLLCKLSWLAYDDPEYAKLRRIVASLAEARDLGDVAAYLLRRTWHKKPHRWRVPALARAFMTEFRR